MTALLLVVLAGMIPTASADQVTWVLSGVTFSDGGTASGSFVYNADTNTYSSINITTTAGSILGGATYTGADPCCTFFNSSFLGVVTNPSLLDLTGTPLLRVVFVTPLTDLGGTSLLSLTPDFSIEGPCFDSGCTGIIFNPATMRNATGGEVVATPEPTSLLLLGMGMVGLAGAAKRKLIRA